MRNIFLVVLLFFVFMTSKAQQYNEYNSISRIALVNYVMDQNGFFQKQENINLKDVRDVVSLYGYDKKSHELYVLTERANCVVTVTEEVHKILKKSKAIPVLKKKDFLDKLQEMNGRLEEKFNLLNEKRRKHINDSIQKAKDDSIKKAKEDSLRFVHHMQKLEEYRNANEWFSIPTKNYRLYCDICDKSFNDGYIRCYGIKNDTIYWPEFVRGELGIVYVENHAAKLSDDILKDYDFLFHCEAFADSLFANVDVLDKTSLIMMNAAGYFDYLEDIRKEAPYGYFKSWSWNDEFSVSFSFNYMNTNKKTIKYIEVFWKITNDVGDVRRTGSFKGTGPLAEWESASWNWDYSSYYVAGDATRMDITKLIITYMDGTKITVPKNKIVFD